MKKLLILITILLLASTCYARQEVASNVGGAIQTGAHTNLSSSAMVQLGTGNCMSIIISSPSTNKGAVYIAPSSGTATSNSFILATSTTIIINVDQLSDVFVEGDTTAGTSQVNVSYLAS